MRVLLWCVLVVVMRCSLPVAIFHGLGDACELEKITGFPAYIQSQMDEGTHVACIESGPSILSIIFKSFSAQAEGACQKLQNDDNYKNKDITVIGLSQGALLARYIAQKCDFGGKVVNLVSIGGPNMGVAGVPHCPYSNYICGYINKFLGWSVVYTEAAQSLVGPAGYYRDTFHFQNYLNSDSFLDQLNNESQDMFDQKSKDKFMSLSQVVLVKFSEDSVIIPRETAWFQDYYHNTTKVKPMNETTLYQKDLIGLKTLDEENKVFLYEAQGDHLQISKEELNEYVVKHIK